MDWSRAKTILIIVFLILNIFMVFMILSTSSNEPFNNDYIRYAKDYLTSKNIEINADIPRVIRNTGKVLYSTKKYNIDALCRLVFGKEIPLSENGNIVDIKVGDEKLIISEDELYIEDRITEGDLWFRDLKTFEENIIKYLKDVGFNKSDLLLDKFSESDQVKEIVFTLKYNKLHIYDQKITAQLNKEGNLIVWAPTKELKNDNGAREVLSVYQILVMGGLPSGVNIEKIDIGYKQISKGDLYGIPVWRILPESGESIFYNGFTGERLY